MNEQCLFIANIKTPCIFISKEGRCIMYILMKCDPLQTHEYPMSTDYLTASNKYVKFVTSVYPLYTYKMKDFKGRTVMTYWNILSSRKKKASQKKNRSFHFHFIKVIIHTKRKSCHCLLMLKLFLSCINLLVLLNTGEEIWKNISSKQILRLLSESYFVFSRTNTFIEDWKKQNMTK